MIFLSLRVVSESTSISLRCRMISRGCNYLRTTSNGFDNITRCFTGSITNGSAVKADSNTAARTDTLSRLDLLEARMKDLERLRRPCFRAAQYNILASYLGSNTEPWFLYGGLTDSPSDKERAKRIAEKFAERDVEGNYINSGWPNYVRDILTKDEIAAVERRHNKFFAWDVRGPKIVSAIKELDADVLSLVELDRYDEFFKPELERLGMKSIWAKRPRQSSKDGCAVCWKESKFELLAHEAFEFSDDLEGKRKDRIALMTCLKMRFCPDEPRLIFVSIHLARNPECPRQGAIRLRQAAQLMQRLKEFADANGCGPDVPAIVAGDWNAESLEEIRSITSALFGLRDMHATAHPLLWGSIDVPSPRTSFTLLRQSRIDYLMYSESVLRLKRVKPNIGMVDTKMAKTMPNAEHPSDHLPILADFEYPTELEIARHSAYQFCMAITYGTALRPMLPEEIKAAFNYFDRDGSGSISAEELTLGVQNLGIHQTTESKKRLKQAFCTIHGKDGEEATLDTFQRAFENHCHYGLRNGNGNCECSSDDQDDEFSNNPFLQDIERAFRFFDLDGNGTLSRDEMYTTLKTISPTPIEDDEIEDIIHRIDLNHDGEVQLKEFATALVKGQHKLDSPPHIIIQKKALSIDTPLSQDEIDTSLTMPSSSSEEEGHIMQML